MRSASFLQIPDRGYREGMAVKIFYRKRPSHRILWTVSPCMSCSLGSGFPAYVKSMAASFPRPQPHWPAHCSPRVWAHCHSGPFPSSAPWNIILANTSRAGSLTIFGSLPNCHLLCKPMSDLLIHNANFPQLPIFPSLLNFSPWPLNTT